MLIALLAVAVFIAVRKAQGDDAATAGPPTTPQQSTSTTTAGPPTGDDRSAAELFATLVVKEEVDRQGYAREAFGEGWLTDSNGCDVRNQVLAEESRVPVERDADGCTVVAGEWLSIYDNYSTPHAEELEIDHVVALAEAWDSGANDWSSERRVQFANDLARPDALIAVSAATNQSKSDRDPAEWMPPNDGAWCRFAAAWINQKAAWQLTIDPAERDALRNVLTSC